MVYELWVYILCVALAGFLSLFLSVYAQLKLKDSPGVGYYILATFFSAVFTFAYAFELSSTSLEQIKFWLRIEYLAMPFIPLLMLFMCLEYVGKKLNQLTGFLLLLIPLTTVFMMNTNDLHHFYYSSVSLRQDIPFAVLDLDYGPWFYVHSLYVFLCLVISIVILLIQAKKSLFKFRMQILLMVTGLLMPIVANHFYLNDLSPYGIDLGPVSMSLAFLFHGTALLSYQMFDVAPIARDTVFENMKEGVIVLNQEKAIVDFNKAIVKVIPVLNNNVIGKTVTDVMNTNQRLAKILQSEQECDFEILIDGEVSHFHIRFTPVETLNHSSIGQIITFVDVTERVTMQGKLQQLASVDGLTQIFNRTFLVKKWELNYERFHNKNVTVIMFDVDHFKKVNDNFGHEVGDIVLAKVAKMAKETLREIDVIGRYGGEEFIIYLPDTSILEGYEVANRIRERIASTPIPFNNQDIRVTSSFGISSAMILLEEDPRQTLQALMRQADQALYEAKRNGRNRVNIE